MIKKIIAIFFAALSLSATLGAWFYLPAEDYLWLKVGTLLFLVLTSVLTVLWWRNQNAVEQNHEAIHAQQRLLKQDTRIIQQYFEAAARKIRGQGSYKFNSVYALPWYLVIGGEKETTGTILQENGLELVNEQRFEAGEGDTQYLRFWSNDTAVVIELGDRIINHTGIDEPLWKVLLQQLQKYRPRQALTGVISVFECDQILKSDRKALKKLADVYQRGIISLSKDLKLELPLYCLFSKANYLADFTDFFESFSADDLENPFGVTLPCDTKRRFNKQQFELEVQVLLSSLVKQQVELMHNSNSEHASGVVALPYQLQIFFERVTELLNDIGRETRVRQAVWIRGAYLLSSGQKGGKCDLLTQVIAEKAEFNAKTQGQQWSGNRNYFVSRVFSHVILPERGITGLNKWRDFGYITARTVMLVVMLCGLIFSGSVLKNNWNEDELWRQESMATILDFERNTSKMSANYSIVDIISSLNALRVTARKGIEPRAWYQRVSVKQEETALRMNSTYQMQLRYLLLPKLEGIISKELYLQTSMGNPGKILEVLRYYLMLFDKNQLDAAAIEGFLFDIIKVKGGVPLDDLVKLSYLVEDLLKSNYDEFLKPDKELIKLATNNLEGLSPERLIYAQIKSLPQYRNQVDLRSMLGPKFDSVFTFTEDFNGYLVPEIFTKAGYHKLDFSAESSLFRHELSVFKLITGQEPDVTFMELADLRKKIQKLYFSEYIRYWEGLIGNIHIKQFNSQPGLVYGLKNIADVSISPMLDVLSVVVNNTSLVVTEQVDDTENSAATASKLKLNRVATSLNKLNQVKRIGGNKLLRMQPAYVVNEAFSEFSGYLKGYGKSGEAAPVDSLLEAVTELSRYLNIAQVNSEPSKVLYKYAVEHAKSDQDPITNLNNLVGKKPEVVTKWTRDLAKQSWEQVILGSSKYINKQWYEGVYLFYAESIKGRFPFYLQGRGEVDLNDFTSFFKPEGRLDQFVEQILKPFVYWDNGVLRLRVIDGMTLAISNRARSQLRQANKVREIFFGPVGQELGIGLELKVGSMSTSVTEFQLREVENVFDYKHGPRIWEELNWPASDVDGYLSANFYLGQDRVATKSYTGQWALFRFLLEGNSSSTSARRVRKFNYSIEGKNIALQYTLRNSSQVLDKLLFTQFLLPKHL
ncbi:type VI secretion system membrane subunit TssM [Shewanella psychropiezotolerans]|uniref:Type VI secretion system membrane subunit TssM n=1 Tax=Shewanella psychropiezotolerans TaxID=2593655 RepID=A0ABX5X246_9GAMM|nr:MULTISPECIES: type VI secretion system membrane subunit TssM [Shewanella]MPY26911.1 type VI secretion system membrane subunit TssM [Shewanella sp. YLB-07]QDO83361.1 type VI secretion system membrane subunit TssM [Shewanella psychropiezotolerans]